MNILNRLFGSQTKTETSAKPLNESVEAITEEPTNKIIEDLFVEKNPPEEPQETDPASEGKLKKFRESNYYSIGWNDGFKYHSIDFLENGKKQINAEFRLIIDQIIEEKEVEILLLKNLIVDAEKLSSESLKKLRYCSAVL